MKTRHIYIITNYYPAPLIHGKPQLILKLINILKLTKVREDCGGAVQPTASANLKTSKVNCNSVKDFIYVHLQLVTTF